jgi:hypothetical protein
MIETLQIYTQLCRVSNFELRGDCPWCNGTDCFSIWPYEAKGRGEFLCDNCGKHGDTKSLFGPWWNRRLPPIDMSWRHAPGK